MRNQTLQSSRLFEPLLTQTSRLLLKSISLVIHTASYCNFTQAKQKYFLLPFKSFLYNFTLDNSNHVLSAYYKQVWKNSVPKSECLLRKLKHQTYFKTTVLASNMQLSLPVKQCFSQQPRKQLITKHDVRDRGTIVVRETVQQVVFSFTMQRRFSTMSVSYFTSATCSVVKKYTQLACIFVSKISHCKSTLKFACEKSSCKSLCKNLHTSFLRGFFVEIRHIARNLCACECCNACGLYCWSYQRDLRFMFTAKGKRHIQVDNFSEQKISR